MGPRASGSRRRRAEPQAGRPRLPAPSAPGRQRPWSGGTIAGGPCCWEPRYGGNRVAEGPGPPRRWVLRSCRGGAFPGRERPQVPHGAGAAAAGAGAVRAKSSGSGRQRGNCRAELQDTGFRPGPDSRQPPRCSLSSGPSAAASAAPVRPWPSPRTTPRTTSPVSGTEMASRSPKPIDTNLSKGLIPSF